jgi:hypothetical protein
MANTNVFYKIIITIVIIALLAAFSFLVGFSKKTESSSTGETVLIADKEENDSEIEGSGKGLTIDELISLVQAMTAKHLAILQEVYENAPLAAKVHIQRAIDASSKGSIRAVEALNKVKQFGNDDENKSQKIFHIISSCNNGGTITPKGNQSTSGESVIFTCVADSGYELVWLRVDNEKKEGITSYTFNNVDKNHTIHAHFKKIKSE